ncbi:hypothetical protein BaRGS_00003363, partial [Batillaria attramentaria]
MWYFDKRDSLTSAPSPNKRFARIRHAQSPGHLANQRLAWHSLQSYRANRQGDRHLLRSYISRGGSQVRDKITTPALLMQHGGENVHPMTPRYSSQDTCHAPSSPIVEHDTSMLERCPLV